MNKMKKKLLSVLLSVVMLASLLVPMVAISAEGTPTATISLGTPELVSRDYDEDGTPEGDVIVIPVMISENTGAFFTARYQVLSNEGLDLHYAVFEEGTVNEYADEGYDVGDFKQKSGKIYIEFDYTVGRDPENTDKTGYQIVHASTSGTKGIATESGTLIYVCFDAPKAGGDYTFELVWLDGTDNVPVEYDMTIDVPTVTYTHEVDCSEHTGGTATCKDKAVCANCGVEYGELDATNHAGGTEIKDAVPAQCNALGYTGDTYCKGCDTKIADGEDIPATEEHVDADNKWETNGTQHFHTCGCGAEFDKENHKGGTATCKDKAVCSVCGVAYGEVNATNHAGGTEIKDAVPAQCNAPGYTGDTYCKGCDAKIADGEEILATEEHVDANNKWETNETQHFHTCGCGAEFDKENHKGGTATCKDKAVCSVCGVAYGEVDATNHAGETEVRDAVDAECNTPGYTGDTYCKDCNTKIADGEEIPATEEHVDANDKWESNGTQHFHTCTCGTEFDKEDHKGGDANCKDKAVCSVCGVAYGEVDADDHDLGEKEVELKPTADAEGKWVQKCSRCDHKVEGKIAKLATEIKNDKVEIKAENPDLPEDLEIKVTDAKKGDDGKIKQEITFDSKYVPGIKGKVTVTYAAPEGENFQVVVVKADGTTAVVESKVVDGKIVFEAELDGKYELVYTEVKAPEKDETPKAPDTGDAMNVAIVVLVALAAVAGIVVVGKKRIAL